MLNKTKHKTRLAQNLKAKHTSNANTKTRREREKVIESLGALFLPHLGRTFPLSEPLNQLWGGRIETVKVWKVYGIEIPGPYRPWAQAQQKGLVTLRPSWNFLNVQTSLGYWIPRGDRLNVPGQVYEPCPGKSWYARETELSNIIGQDGTKFQDHKCCTALSPKHPL